MSLDAMKQALTALEEIADEVFSPYDNKLGDAILALRAAIEQAEKQEPVCGHGVRITKCPFCRPLEQKPVAWMYVNTDGECEQIALYTAPRQWQGLTDEEKHQLNDALNLQGRFPIIDAIEAKLKERNK